MEPEILIHHRSSYHYRADMHKKNNLIMPVDRLDYADFLKTLYGIF